MSFIAIDAGQTSIKVAICADGQSVTKLTFPGIRTDLPLLPQLAEVTAKASAETGINPNTLTAGVSGLTNLEADATKLLSLTQAVGIQKVILAHDSITAFLGTLGDENGVVVASGTGVVTFGVGPSSTARVDGWGWIMGDAGSGFWIGKQALEAVMRAHDKRGGATQLTERVQMHFPNLEDAYIEIQSNPERVQVVASFAKDVSELAQTDLIAKEISDLAAMELADSVATAWQRVSRPSLRPKIAVTGSVFKNSRLHETFINLLQAKIEAFDLVETEGDGLTGAIALTRLGDNHPLLQAASVAVNS